MADTGKIGRFPMPTTFWVVQQIPDELVPMFGFKGEEIPEEYRDEIEYQYQMKYPDGTVYRMPVLIEYIDDPEAPVVAFVVGDTIEVDGVPVVVENWEVRPVPSTGNLGAYLYHQVKIRVADKVKSDG